MKINLHQSIRWLLVLSLLILAVGCEYDGPVNAWEEAQKKTPVVPTITQVLPEDAATASEITIIGQDFASDSDGNIVYFDNVQATIKSATSTEIVVFRPNITGDSLIIKVVADGAVGLAKYTKSYALAPVVEPFGIFIDTDLIAAVAVTPSENLYVTMGDAAGTILRLTPEGRRDDSYVAEGDKFASDMKMAPDGSIYFIRKQNRIYRVAPEGGEGEIILTLGRNDKVKFFDFDENGNLYAGGEETGLVVVRPDLSFTNLGLLPAYDIQTVRVYSGAVYVGAIFSDDPEGAPNGIIGGIWKYPISDATGTLGAGELVLDWGQTGSFADSELKDLTFSEDGQMYIACTDSIPLLTLNMDGTVSPYYLGLIDPPIDKLIWGSGNYLYAIVNRRVAKSDGGLLLKINMGKASAPYYGRK